MDKSKARKAAFGVHSIKQFWKISGRSLLWTTIMVHDAGSFIIITIITKQFELSFDF